MRDHTAASETRMKLTGRITVSFAITFAFTFHMIIHYIMESKLYNPVSLLALIPFTYLGWWLGEQYDVAKYASERDTLTFIHNRRYLENRFPKLAAYAKRKRLNLECCLIDINGFKQINDRYGHSAGDVVLRNVANMIQQLAPKRSIVARWGGDEFVLVSVVQEGEHQPRAALQELEQSMVEFSEKMMQDISVSTGIAYSTLEQEASLERLIQLSIQRLHQARMQETTDNSAEVIELITERHPSTNETLPSMEYEQHKIQ